MAEHVLEEDATACLAGDGKGCDVPKDTVPDLAIDSARGTKSEAKGGFGYEWTGRRVQV
jgi:hypothetical protein